MWVKEKFRLVSSHHQQHYHNHNHYDGNHHRLYLYGRHFLYGHALNITSAEVLPSLYFFLTTTAWFERRKAKRKEGVISVKEPPSPHFQQLQTSVAPAAVVRSFTSFHFIPLNNSISFTLLLSPSSSSFHFIDLH